jgi:hypothetical protein
MTLELKLTSQPVVSKVFKGQIFADDLPSLIMINNDKTEVVAADSRLASLAFRSNSFRC